MTEPIVFADTPVSIFQHEGNNGRQSRRLFMAIKGEALADIPDEMFAIKISQSKNPELAGKPVFKYFGYRLNDDTPFSSVAPTGTRIDTPTADTKAEVLAKLAGIKGAVFSMAVNLNGTFANIKTPDGNFTLFDEKAFPQTQGRPGYYLSRDTIANVTLTKATSANGPYYRVAIETSMMPDDIFVRAGKSRVWGSDDASDASNGQQEAEPEQNDGAAW